MRRSASAPATGLARADRFAVTLGHMAGKRKRDTPTSQDAKELSAALLGPVDERVKKINTGSTTFDRGRKLVAEGEQLMMEAIVLFREADVPVSKIAESTGLSAHQVGRYVKQAEADSDEDRDERSADASTADTPAAPQGRGQGDADGSSSTSATAV